MTIHWLPNQWNIFSFLDSRVKYLENWHQALYCITVWFTFRAALQYCGTLLQVSWRSVVWLCVCLEVATVSHTSMRCGAWTSITAAQSECWVLRKTEFMPHLHCAPGRITGIRLYCARIRQPLSDSSHATTNHRLAYLHFGYTGHILWN